MNRTRKQKNLKELETERVSRSWPASRILAIIMVILVTGSALDYSGIDISYAQQVLSASSDEKEALTAEDDTLDENEAGTEDVTSDEKSLWEKNQWNIVWFIIIAVIVVTTVQRLFLRAMKKKEEAKE